MPTLYYDATTVGEQIDHIGKESEVVRARAVIEVGPADADGKLFRSVADWEALLDLCIEHEYDMSVYDDALLRGKYHPALQERPLPEIADQPDPLGDLVEELLDIADRLSKQAQNLRGLVTSLSDVAATLTEAATTLEEMGTTELPRLLKVSGDPDKGGGGS